MTIIIGIILTLFTVMAWLDLKRAVFFIAALLPVYLVRFNILGLPTTLLEGMILITFAIWFIRVFCPQLSIIIKKKTIRRPYPFTWEIMAIAIVSFAAIAVAGFTNSALGVWKAYFFEPLLFFILLLNVIKDKKDWLKIISALAISAAAISLFAIYQKITGQFIANPFWSLAATRRVVSFFSYPNAVGLFLAPLVPLFAAWFLFMSNKITNWPKKILIALTIIISILAIYFAKSEGALIGLLAGLFVGGLLAGKRLRILTISLGVLVIAGILISAPARSFVISKLTLHDLSGEIRRRQWIETRLSLTGLKALTGNGLSNYQAAVKPYHQEGIFFNSDNLPDFDAKLRASGAMREKYWQPVEIYMYPHNIFLNFWSELGIIGALLFSWVIIKFLIIMFKLFNHLNNRKDRMRFWALGLGCSMIVIVIHGLVDVPYFKNDLSVMFWMLIALGGWLNLTYQSQSSAE